MTAQASVSYLAPSTAVSVGPDISETLLQGSLSGAKQMMAAFDRVAQACSSFSGTVEGLAMTVTIATENFPPIGDETVALSVTADLTASGASINGDIAAVRHGGTVIVVTNVAYPQLDNSLTQSVMALAYGKVAARW